MRHVYAYLHKSPWLLCQQNTYLTTGTAIFSRFIICAYIIISMWTFIIKRRVIFGVLVLLLFNCNKRSARAFPFLMSIVMEAYPLMQRSSFLFLGLVVENVMVGKLGIVVVSTRGSIMSCSYMQALS